MTRIAALLCNNFPEFLCLFLARQPPPPVGHGFLIHEVSRSHTQNDAPQSVGFLWTSDQLVAQASTWQHTTFTT